MAFKTVNDLSTDNTVALGGVNRKTNKANPTSVTGFYLGSREVDSPKSKTGKAFIHVFQSSEGNVGVWGKTDLDRKIQAAPLGTLTRVSFTGMMKIPGKNDMYKYSVEVDEDQRIDVAEPASPEPAAPAADFNAGYDEPTEEEEDLDLPPPPVARRPANPAAAASSDAQARVQALLGKRK